MKRLYGDYNKDKSLPIISDKTPKTKLNKWIPEHIND